MFSYFPERSAEESFQQQYFRVKPSDVEAHVGSEVTLLCEIEHRSGEVQWTKDGYALGEWSFELQPLATNLRPL